MKTGWEKQFANGNIIQWTYVCMYLQCTTYL